MRFPQPNVPAPVVRYAPLVQGQDRRSEAGAEAQRRQRRRSVAQDRIRRRHQRDDHRRLWSRPHRSHAGKTSPSQRRSRACTAAHPLPRDDPRPSQERRRQAQETDRRQRPVQCRISRSRTGAARLGLIFKTPSSVARCHASSSRPSKRASKSACPAAAWPATTAPTSRSGCFDGKYHDVDSDSRSFEMARQQGFLTAFKQAQPVIPEPTRRSRSSVPRTTWARSSAT